jgi:oligoribonuclease NrnB/cAMP/cGMP phosphodiesterase (DHH superfamily)
MYEYFENAIEPENRDLKHKVIFPSKTTFKGRRWDSWDRNDRERTIDNCGNRLVITHNDADGLVAGALFIDHFGEDDVDVLSIDYENIEHTFEYISENAEGLEELYVSDLNLDEVYDVIGEVANMVESFVWIDHHEWGEKEEKVANMGVDIRINEERAATGLVHQYVINNGYESNDKVRETVKMTEDHDLWNHDMDSVTIGSHKVCISKVFSQMAFYSDTEKFLNEILDYGKDFIENEEELLRGDKSSGFIAQMESEHNMKVEYILENETEIKEIGGYRVGFAHGRASPGALLEELVDREDIEILIHTKPQYPPKASIRSTDDFSGCHKIAEKLGGGGHEQAAGCKPEDIAGEPLEFINYIQNRGQSLKDAAEEALKEHLNQKD